MTAQKYLHELLRDDQEPFRLKNYIEDRKCQLKRSNSHRSTSLQVIKRNPIMETSPIATSRRNFCIDSCFVAFNASQEVTKSPFPNFLSSASARSPCRNHNGSVFLNIPSRTASLLLDAALKIQKQQSSTNSKPKTQIKNLGFGLFSSIFKKLKDRKRSRKSELGFVDVKKPINSGASFSGSLDNSRRSSSRWSESIEERRSLDMETSSSSLYENSKEIDLVAQEGENGALKMFCSSPHSPIRFSLQTSSSSGGCTPVFASPSDSPSRRTKQDADCFKLNLSEKFGNKEEEEKDQSSPISVLDPPFEKEEIGNESLYEEEDYDVECTFALVQKAKEKLLYKLSRFEKLAELDPIELEKRMQDEEEYENGEEEDEELLPIDEDSHSYVNEVLSRSDILKHNNKKRVPLDMEKLVSDLISEERDSINNNNNKWLENGGEILVGRVCRKLEWWKESESNTIDMMVEFDMRCELDQWKIFQRQKEETCFEFEVGILGVLVEEFTYELLQAVK